MACCTPFDQNIEAGDEYIYAFVGNGFERSPDVSALVAVGNHELDTVIKNLAALNTGLYNDKCCDWLDWLAKGVYGFDRPTIAIGDIVAADGGFGRFGFGEHGFGYGALGVEPGYETVSDDIFKRLLQWHLYRGDGFQFCISWLRKRILRFVGCDSADITLSGWAFTITLPISVNATYFKYLLIAGKLVLPEQYTYTVTIA